MAASVLGKRVRDWKKLDEAHMRRGELVTVFFSTDGPAFAPAEKTGARGRARVYSEATIEALLVAKLVLRLSLRAVEGFAQGMARLAQAAWPVPDYTTLCRRERTLEVELGTVRDPGKKQVLIVDSTGLKVFGEGEWKVRVHGTDGKRRTWRKLHLLVDRETGQIIAAEVTDGSAHDAPVLERLLPQDLSNTVVLGDGAYHTKSLHKLVHARGGTLLSPPPKNARVWKGYSQRKEDRAFAFRNSQLTPLQRLGRTAWKVKTGLSQRSFVECTNNRLKSITGGHVSAREDERQEVELRLRCKLINFLAVPGQSLRA